MRVAPSMVVSSSGLEIAACAASTARVSPLPTPMPIRAGTGVRHDRLDVGEVEVDQTRDGDQIGDALHALAQHFVGEAEGFHQRDLLLHHSQKAVVGNCHERVNFGAQVVEPLFGDALAAAPLEGETAW